MMPSSSSFDINKSVAFKKLDIPRIKNGKRTNFVTDWWKKLKSPTIITETDSVGCVKFSPISPYNYISAHSSKVSLFNGNTDDIVHVYSDFKEKVLSINYRSDGKLLCGSDQTGYIQIFDEQNNKAHALRKFRAHEKSIHVCEFSPNNTQLFSASDDLKWKLWDIASADAVLTRTAHTDYIRCGSTLRTNSNLWFTGSYDHSVSLWDIRCPESHPNLSISHNQPVEDILVHPNGFLLISCGGNTIRIWDLANGGKPLHQITSHIKTITCLAFSHECGYFHSSSLDRNVKSYSMQTYEVMNNMRYDLPILSMDIAANNKKVIVGMIDSSQNNGLMHLKSYPHSIINKSDINDDGNSISTFSSRELFNEEPRTLKLYFDSKTFTKAHNIKVVKKPKTQIFDKYEIFLKKFEHIKALKYVLEKRHKIPASVIVEVIREIMRRAAVVIALKGCHVQDIIRILNFVSENIVHLQYTQVLIKFSHAFLDNQHAMNHLQQKLTDYNYREGYISAINRLKNVLRIQIEFISKSFEIIGHLDMIQVLSSIPKTISSNDPQITYQNNIDILGDNSNSTNRL